MTIAASRLTGHTWPRVAVRLVAGVAMLLAACSPAAPAASPTTAPAAAKPTEAAKPAAAAATTAPAPLASPATAASPAAKPAASPIASLVPSPAAKPAASAPITAGIASFDEAAVANFYRGKTIRFIVGFPAGGGYDAYARMFARYMGKYIPGNPTIVVENIGGASSSIALTQVYNTLPKDGTVLTSGDPTLALPQILGTTTYDFDNSKWNWIGAPSVYEYFYVVTKSGLQRAGITRFEDHIGPKGKQLAVGQSGPGVALNGTLILAAITGANIKNVLGYAGTAPERLAMDSGEIDGIFTSWDSIKVTEANELANGSHVLFMQFPKDPVKGVPYPVPSLWDYAKTDEDRQMLQYGAIATHEFARAWAMAPGVPADRLAAIQTAFVKTATDSDLLADAEKAKLDINPLSGPQVTRTVADFYTMPESVKNRLRTVLNVKLS